MKKFRKVLVTCVMFGLTMGVSFGSAFVPVNPTSTYGSPAAFLPDTPTPATWVLLSSLGLGIIPGTTTLTLAGTGDVCYFSACSVETNTNTITNPFLGGFSTGAGLPLILSTLGDTANTGPTGTGDWLANIANDFFITSTGSVNVLVPSTALYAVFVLRDSHYGDNSDANQDLGINISVSAVPEPATYGLLLVGLGGLFALRRFRRS